MSVTFRPTEGPIDHYSVECINCNVTHSEEFATWDDAAEFTRAVREERATVTGCKGEEYYCSEAAFTNACETVGEVPETNVAVGNATDILDALGVDFRFEPTPEEAANDLFGIAGVELCGTLNAEDFMGRVLTALALAPESAEIPSHAAVGAPNIIRGHREEGYVQNRLRELHEIAQFAINHDRQVTWS